MSQTIDLRSRRSGKGEPKPGDRVPPHNLQAEESLIGAMLLSRDAIGPAVESCAAADFYKPAHMHIFSAIVSLWSRGEPADPVTVADELNRADLLEAIGGAATLLSLQMNTPATSNAARYAQIVEEHALLRKLISTAGEIAEMGYAVPEDVSTAVDTAESMMFEVAQRRVADTMAPIRDLLSQSLDRLEALYDRGESITGVPTGFSDLDERLSGLQPNALLIIGARPAMGKALAIDTPLPTPEGWVAMGDVRVGDRVYDERGEPCRVSYISPVYEDRICYRVSFDDGSEIVADAEHLWSVYDRFSWKNVVDNGYTHVPFRFDLPIELTTQELLDGGVRNADDGANWFIPNAMALEVPDVELPIEPYVFGCWLAAGKPADCEVSLPNDDLAHFKVQLEWSGYALRRSGCGGSETRVVLGTGAWSGYQNTTRNLRQELDDSGWVNGGPNSDSLRYLRASAKQRLSVLQGIMDVGGSVSNSGEARFESDDPRLLALVRELACSLGHKVGRQEPVPMAEHAAEGVQWWRLQWVPLDPIFRIERLATACSATVGESSLRRAITAIEPIETVPVRCITVDSPNSLYLAGADMVPTHNTSFALNMVSNAAASGAPVLFFSLEMSHLEITQRLLCAEARVDAGRLRNGNLHDTDWPKINHAIGKLGEAPIFIDDNPNCTVMDVRAKARRLKASPGGLGLVVIDYLQLMTGRAGAESRQVEVSEMSRGLKILARELSVPVIALSQLSRTLEQRADKRPILADLRESGSLEQDADVVMFLYRDEVYNAESPDKGTAEVIVAKHRNGPVGITQLAFIDRYTRFANMAKV